MERSVQLRLVLAAPVLGAIYYYFLIFLISWTSASIWLRGGLEFFLTDTSPR
jgi:hypothetical protein